MKKLLLLTLFSLLPLGTVNAAFFISGKEMCSYGDYSYQIGPNVMFADISVQVGKNVMFPDYKLYFRSENYSVNEAAGIFPAIWKFNEN